MNTLNNLFNVVNSSCKLQSINNLVNKENLNQLFLIKIAKNNGKAIKVLNGEELFKEQDLLTLKEWAIKEQQEIFKDDFHRIDLNEEKILFFRKIESEDSIALMGHVLDYTLMNRLLLLELRQKHLMEILQ